MGEAIRTQSPAAAGNGEQAQYLTFMLGGETFAIGILHIREILEYGGITTVPLLPEYVRGDINLRGAVVPVIVLAVRFSRSPSPVTRRTCVVSIDVESEGEQHSIGVTVDTVNEVASLTGAAVSAEYGRMPGCGVRLAGTS